MAMKLEVYKDKAGEYRWRGVASNGNIVADSGEGYSDRKAAEYAARNIQENIPGARINYVEPEKPKSSE